jgi:O-antigen biosynthesis protein WbqP
MSLVGPRPALFNQDDLLALRRAAGVDGLRPGITGWAQVNGRDELDLAQKVAFEAEYRRRAGLLFDLRILFATAVQVLRPRGIAH